MAAKAIQAAAALSKAIGLGGGGHSISSAEQHAKALMMPHRSSGGVQAHVEEVRLIPLLLLSASARRTPLTFCILLSLSLSLSLSFFLSLFLSLCLSLSLSLSLSLALTHSLTRWRSMTTRNKHGGRSRERRPFIKSKMNVVRQKNKIFLRLLL